MSGNGKLRAGEIRGVIFDYGQVLCRRPVPAHWDRMAQALGIGHDSFLPRWGAPRDLYDRGDLTPADYWQKVAEAPVSAALLDELRRWDVEMWSDLDAGMVAWCDRLREAGLKTGLLSNMNFDMADYVRAEFDWLHRMNAHVLSCDLHLVKPEPAIYEHTLASLGLKPAEALFIDDREPNIQGAREAGMQGLVFQGIEPLRRELAAAGFAPLP